MSLRPLSQSLPKVTRQVCSRKYIMLGRLVTHWPEIVGEELAHKTQPIKLRYQKKKEKQKGSSTASLDVAASSADATLLHYRKDLILERINQIFGERWVTSVRFVAVAANASLPPARRKPLSPSMAEKKNLSEMLENISDPDIYERLEKLGAAMIVDRKHP